MTFWIRQMVLGLILWSCIRYESELKSEKSRKLYVADLANDIDCNFPPWIQFPVMRPPISWNEFPTIFWYNYADLFPPDWLGANWLKPLCVTWFGTDSLRRNHSCLFIKTNLCVFLDVSYVTTCRHIQEQFDINSKISFNAISFLSLFGISIFKTGKVYQALSIF